MNENGTPRGPGAMGDATRGGERDGAPRLRDVSDPHEFDDVKRAYRALDDEPVPPSLDASVLDAARAAVRPQRTKPRWLVPASIAATVLIAVGVSLDVRREASREAAARYDDVSTAAPAGGVAAELVQAPAEESSSATASAPAQARADSESHAASNAARSDAATSAEFAKSVEPSRPEAFPMAPPAAAPAPPPPPEFAPPPVARAPAVASVAAPVSAPAPASPAPEAAASIVADSPKAPPPAADASTGTDTTLREVAQPRAAGALAAQDSAAERRKSEAARRTPEEWLRDIEALRRAGRTADADAEIARFRAAYPDYPRR